jgi:hypothetical protein
MDAATVKGLLDFFVKRAAVMRSFASGVAGWHVFLLFYRKPDQLSVYYTPPGFAFA